VKRGGELPPSLIGKIVRRTGIRVGKLWRFRISDVEEWERHQGVDQDEINALVNEITEEAKKGRR
jgi:hypothetical protein